MATELWLDDERFMLQGYEIILNADSPVAYDSGSIYSGRSRGWGEDGGTWRGTIRGFTKPDGPVVLSGYDFITKLTGVDAYEGLSAVLISDPHPVTDPEEEFDTWSVVGMLFEGGLPQYPQPEAP